MKNWILAFRPKTLTAAIIPILVGTAAVYSKFYQFDLSIFILTLVSALSIQIATNLFNDAIDFKKGADQKDRIGPIRVTQSGLISEKSVWLMAFLFLAIAIIAGIPLVLKAGKFILVIGLISVFLAYSYTGGPFPLAYLGLGDFFVILFFGIIAVVGTAYLQTPILEPSFFVLGFEVGCLSAVLIAINNLRDSEQDRRVGKNTLAVIWGDNFVKKEIFFLVCAPFVISFWQILNTSNLNRLIVILACPLGYKLLNDIYFLKNKIDLNSHLGKAAALHFFYGILLTLGFII